MLFCIVLKGFLKNNWIENFEIGKEKICFINSPYWSLVRMHPKSGLVTTKLRGSREGVETWLGLENKLFVNMSDSMFSKKNKKKKKRVLYLY